MHLVRFSTRVEQAAAHIQEDLRRGRWRGVLPGNDRLAAELGVSKDTMHSALGLLERRGWLVSQGAGRPRRIRLPRSKVPRPLRVAILLTEATDVHWHFIVELRHELANAGHTVSIASQALSELGMDVARIARLVQCTDVDAWVVFAGSREVLEWFGLQPMPAFALFGRQHGLPIAGAWLDRGPAIHAATRTLAELGHRRIAMLFDRRHRLPHPGPAAQAFLDELAAQGIPTGSYNLPDWEPSAEGLQACLEKLFGMTPPTALLIDESRCFAATQAFLAQRRLHVPHDASLVSMDDDPTFAWCKPSVAHMRIDLAPLVRQVVRWAARTSIGRRDLRQHRTPASFVPGGTIGPLRSRQE